MAKFHRRQFLAGSLACGLAAAPLGPLRAQHSLELHRDFVDLMKPETQDAIERGLEFLASRQTEDGAFQGTRYERNVAVVSLAGTAFMAHGSTPGRGPYGTQVERAVEYILQHTEDDGFIRAAEAVSHGPMYGHGFAT
jgi:squalene cyclase